MSPAPTARARPSPSCGHFSRRRATASMPIPRPIWCASTSASAWPASSSSEEHLTALLEECERANGGPAASPFSRSPRRRRSWPSPASRPISLLLEVGLGGRFDATNVIRRPAATVITPVSLDHQHFLGDTVAAIAFEKAGILKPGAPAVVAAAAARSRSRARGAGARAGRAAVPRGQGMAGFARGRGRPRLPGKDGARFAAARAVGRASDTTMPAPRSPRSTASQASSSAEDALARGMQDVEWPARLQRLLKGPLVEALPRNGELWLDGGHNQAGGDGAGAGAGGLAGQAGVAGLRHAQDPRRRGIPEASGRFAPRNWQEWRYRARQTRFRPRKPPKPRARRACALMPARASPRRSRAVAKPDSRVLICGSLYLAGRVLEENG